MRLGRSEGPYHKDMKAEGRDWDFTRPEKGRLRAMWEAVESICSNAHFKRSLCLLVGNGQQDRRVSRGPGWKAHLVYSCRENHSRVEVVKVSEMIGFRVDTFLRWCLK